MPGMLLSFWPCAVCAVPEAIAYPAPTGPNNTAYYAIAYLKSATQ